MSKIIKIENYRVEVTPKVYEYTVGGRRDEKHILDDCKNTCEEMLEQIKRHVDDIDTVEIKYDEIELCSHCQMLWELDPETGEPMCCTKAQEEFEKEKSKQA